MTKGEKTRGSGLYTEAQFVSFIKSALRRASGRWKPRSECLRRARVQRGLYKCEMCSELTPTTVVVDGKKRKGIEVDHIHPVIDTQVGFISWDSFIERLFVEEEGFRALCYKCHSGVTEKQRVERKNTKQSRDGQLVQADGKEDE